MAAQTETVRGLELRLVSEFVMDGALLTVTDNTTTRPLLVVRRDHARPSWMADVRNATSDGVELALLEDIVALVRETLALADPPPLLDAPGFSDDIDAWCRPSDADAWANGHCFEITMCSLADDDDGIEFVSTSSPHRLDLVQWGGHGSQTAKVYLSGFPSVRPHQPHSDLVVLDLLLDRARRELGIPRPARHLAPPTGAGRRVPPRPPLPVPWPRELEVPPEVGRLHTLGMAAPSGLVAWELLAGDNGRARQHRHDELYPGTGRVPFAARIDNDDHACLIPATGEVVIVHMHASSGWEARGERFPDIWAFLETRLMPDLLERLDDDASYARDHPEVIRTDDAYAVPAAWPAEAAIPPELALLHGAGLVDLDAWTLLTGEHGTHLASDSLFFPSNPDSEWVVFAQRRERGLRASWHRHDGRVAVTRWLDDPADSPEATYDDVRSFLAGAVFPDFLARHRAECTAERRERRLESRAAFSPARWWQLRARIDLFDDPRIIGEGPHYALPPQTRSLLVFPLDPDLLPDAAECFGMFLDDLDGQSFVPGRRDVDVVITPFIGETLRAAGVPDRFEFWVTSGRKRVGRGVMLGEVLDPRFPRRVPHDWPPPGHGTS
ncbi:hypothetical protein [Actinomycetospora soli]|uniref:hypothetical protein n=1 Tax=Actinomycetospora soli TaxID=2893887 RepID=UPI001E2AE5DD|nr:hypothetical protein [Actinomycetospora soli]MCD2191250.1 hypothetical protein [Actinomycetospora soli]